MNDTERLVKKYYHKKGMTCSEISKITGMSVGAIEAILGITWDHIGSKREKQSSFPPQLLMDYDRTRLMILKKYGGEKYKNVGNR